MRGTARRPVTLDPHVARSAPDAPGAAGVARRSATPLALAAAALACVVLAPAVVLAVDVRGTLTVPSDYAASAAPAETDAQRSRARYWEEWNGVLDPRPARLDPSRELAVVLTGQGAPSEGEQPPYRLHNGSLAPATIVARAGTAIQIRNDDGVAYELFAEGNEEIGPISTAPGNVRPITVPPEGSWPLRDRIHPHVRGHLHAVADLVARAFVEPSGAYTFRGVAPGTYTLRVFHGAGEVASQQVVVPEGGQLTVPAISLHAVADAHAAGDAPAAGAAAPSEPTP